MGSFFGVFICLHWLLSSPFTLGTEQTKNALPMEGSSESPLGVEDGVFGLLISFLSRRISSSFPAVSPMGCVT